MAERGPGYNFQLDSENPHQQLLKGYMRWGPISFRDTAAGKPYSVKRLPTTIDNKGNLKEYTDVKFVQSIVACKDRLQRLIVNDEKLSFTLLELEWEVELMRNGGHLLL